MLSLRCSSPMDTTSQPLSTVCTTSQPPPTMVQRVRLFENEGLIGLSEAIYGIAATIAVDSLADLEKEDAEKGFSFLVRPLFLLPDRLPTESSAATASSFCQLNGESQLIRLVKA